MEPKYKLLESSRGSNYYAVVVSVLFGIIGILIQIMIFGIFCFIGAGIFLLFTLRFKDFILFSDDEIVRNKGFIGNIKVENIDYKDIDKANVGTVKGDTLVVLVFKENIHHKNMGYSLSASFKKEDERIQFLIYLNQKGIKLYWDEETLSKIFGEANVKKERFTLFSSKYFVEGNTEPIIK